MQTASVTIKYQNDADTAYVTIIYQNDADIYYAIIGNQLLLQ